MQRRATTGKTRLIGEIATAARRKAVARDRANAAAFTRLFYAHVPPADLQARSKSQLAAAAVGFWRFARARDGTRAKIRAFNPTQKADGWTTDRTIVEIVTDNTPFLVDSLTASFNRIGLTVHLAIHPMAEIVRSRGILRHLDAAAANAPPTGSESFMQFHVDRHVSAQKLAEIEKKVRAVLKDIGIAVRDWQPMRRKLAEIIDTMHQQPGPESTASRAETQSFLKWIAADNFTLLGYREYRYARGRSKLAICPGGLGLMRRKSRTIFEILRDGQPLSPILKKFVDATQPLAIAKSDTLSTVHRSVLLDVLGVRIFDRRGQVTGMKFIVGLFASSAYSHDATNVPILDRKLRQAQTHAGFVAASHDDTALAHILASYPRDELFAIDENTLLTNALGILHLQERQRVALFLRSDPLARFVSGLVYIPRERFNTPLRLAIAKILEDGLGGELASFAPEFNPDSMLARVLYILRLQPTKGPVPQFRRAGIRRIERQIEDAMRSWSDDLHDALYARFGEQRGGEMTASYRAAFGPGYQETYAAAHAIDDIAKIESVLAGNGLQLNLYRRDDDAPDLLRLKLYQPDEAVPLAEILPMLENMGLNVIGEIPNEVQIATHDRTVWIHDFKARIARHDQDPAFEPLQVRDIFHDALDKIFKGDAEDDGFNALVLGTGLTWRQVALLRGCCKFLLQTRIPFSLAYMAHTLAANPDITAQLVKLFETRFDPRLVGPTQRARDEAQIQAKIEADLIAVASLDEDRILRRFTDLIASMLRTNYFQRNPTEGGDTPKPYISFKIDAAHVDGLPQPRPWVEIFVCAPDMEGCHLRGGPVARGGIRWSERREDFRTEILGLMKTQMVKNTVIVPVGSKGGFVVKRPASDPQAAQAQGIACYRILIKGLLDLTDNLQGSKTAPPPDTVCHDGPDPYLVVAADKGTARFSDIANTISADYDYWLGDAFASGGSAGYDHKAMGITARGAWESVKRHFREMGRDCQKEDFTVIGVGGMAGDVFGNGMLLSRHIKLIGAFDHAHIFIDPTPKPDPSFAERRRLFGAPRARWRDYKKSLISRGGGVFERSAKSIPVSTQMARLFGLKRKQITPNELIKAMLSAPTDLLWFGGIGTYVKARDETHAQTDDRSNDNVRVDAADLKAKIVGEGANLAVTQFGRIEYARANGRINADFVDNAAGVDCSDHEVNIKIALGDGGDTGDRGHLTVSARNKLLSEMTEEVTRLVLNDAYLQTQAISLAVRAGGELLDAHWDLIRQLERSGALDRAIEFLPDDETLAERRALGEGLARPEYAVLLAYAKMNLHAALLPSTAPDDPYLVRDLSRYFPKQLSNRFSDQIARHRLRREIIATYLTNSMLHRVGASFVTEMERRTGAGPADIACAYVAARDIFGLRPLWQAIEGLDNHVSPELQSQMMRKLEQLAMRTTSWILGHARRPFDIATIVAAYRPNVANLLVLLPNIIAAADRADIVTEADKLTAAGVPGDLARRIVTLDLSTGVCDIVSAARRRRRPVREAGRLYFEIGTTLGFDWLRRAAALVLADSPWEIMAVNSIVDDSYSYQSQLTGDMLRAKKKPSRQPKMPVDERLTGRLAAWATPQSHAVTRALNIIDDIRSTPERDLAMLTVAIRQLGRLTHNKSRNGG